MSLLYNLIYKGNPMNPEEGKKLYVVLKSRRLVKIDEVTKKISEKLNIHEDLCRSVLNCWNKVSVEYLTDGCSVELGKAGYVYLRVSSEGAYDEKDAGSRLVRNIKGHINFSKETKEAFNNCELMNVGTMTSGINKRIEPEEEE